MLRAIVALGNIGKEYEKTYHNVGVFVAKKVIDLAEQNGKRAYLYLPTTFMNVSGPAIASWMKMHNLKNDEILVVHDEGDLLKGEYKISANGGSAGHNGVASVIESLGADEFFRLRVGIRDPQEQDRKKTMDFVLSNWSKADEDAFTEVAKNAWAEIALSFADSV